MNLKIKLSAIITLLAVVIATILLSSFSLNQQIKQLNTSWNQQNSVIMEKNKALFQITHHFGYGGFIHHFKNLVLRKDPQYIDLATYEMAQTKQAIQLFNSLVTNEKEFWATKSLSNTVELYQQKLNFVIQYLDNYHNSANALDKDVKVDDSAAFEALNILAEQINVNNHLAMKLFDKKYQQLQQLNLVQMLLIVPFVIVAGLYISYYMIKVTLAYDAFKSIFSLSPDALIVLNHKGKIIRANPKASRIFGYTSEEFIKLPVELLIPAQMRDGHESLRLKFQQQNGFRDRQSPHAEVMALRKNGEPFPVEIGLSSFGPHGKKNTLAVIKDLSDLKDLERLSSTDHLTQIANRLKMDELIEKEIQRSSRYGSPLSLIICDIDHFKQVNDQHGHPVGDLVLKRFAQLLTDRIRNTDTCGRWGGEEFCILCPNTELEDVLLLAESIRQSVVETNFTPVEKLTASFGVTSFKGGGDDAHQFILRADEALYQVKQTGRNQVAKG